MEELKYLDDKVLSLLELREDCLFHKLNKEQINYYINGSINIGKKTAENFKNTSIKKLLKINDVEIIIDESNKKKNLELRAEIHFDKKIRQIKIYKNSIKQIYNSLKALGLNLTEKEIYEIHLAHEFYHFIEFKNNRYTNKSLNEIVYFSLGPIKRKSSILKTREIAAHIFCKELLNLKFHPKLLDYMYLVEIDSQSSNELKKNVKELREKYFD